MGPLVCGVIGATKPVFDIWGDTVNEASRMDSTGLLGYIQVCRHRSQENFVSMKFYFLNFSVQASEKVALIVGERGYAVKERGIINVKGKGNMKTYFILGRKISRRIGRGSGAANNNLAEVVYGMVRARRRRTFKRDKDNLERLESGASSDRVSESGDGRSSYKKSDGSSKLSRRNPISRSIRRSVVSVKVETQV